MTMTDELNTLIEIHKSDIQLRVLQRELDEVPQRMASLDDEGEAVHRKVMDLQQKWKTTRQQREEVELLVTQLERKMENFQNVARQARSNREYSESILKVEEVRHRIRKVEDRLLDAMEAEETAQRQWKKGEACAEPHLKTIEAAKMALEHRQQQIEQEMEQLRNMRTQKLVRLGKTYAKEYERVAAGRNGIALAAVTDQTCSACHIRLRPRLYQALLTMTDLVYCESCHRILFLVERKHQQVAAKG